MARKEYWYKAYTCPYYQSNDVKSLGCEVGYLSFPDKIAALELMDNFCASDWESCPFAQIMNRYEERKYKENEYRKSKRNDARRNGRKD